MTESVVEQAALALLEDHRLEICCVARDFSRIVRREV